jgi:hypothetical protein
MLMSRVPEAVIKSRDDPGELADRVAYAIELGERARQATRADVRKACSETSQAVLKARPRSVVAAERDALIAKARMLGSGSVADQLRRQADQLLEDEPAAPQRTAGQPVTKARGGWTRFPGLQAAVFDHRGRFLGGVDPTRIVQKSDGTEALTPVFDPDGKLVGVCPPDAITPVTTNTANIAKARKRPSR